MKLSSLFLFFLLSCGSPEQGCSVYQDVVECRELNPEELAILASVITCLDADSDTPPPMIAITRGETVKVGDGEVLGLHMDYSHTIAIPEDWERWERDWGLKREASVAHELIHYVLEQETGGSDGRHKLPVWDRQEECYD